MGGMGMGGRDWMDGEWGGWMDGGSSQLAVAMAIANL